MQPTRYDVVAHLASGVQAQAVLTWDADGHAHLEPPIPMEWAQQEAIKLARVLHRDPKAKLIRWRG